MQTDEKPMIEIQGILVSLDLFSEFFCCDLATCKGCCCVEGDAGAPLDIDEIAEIEEAMEVVWDELTEEAKEVINNQGVAYADPSGELVTSIVNNRDCVFAQHSEDGTCYCVLDKAYREGRTSFQKPISCHLYPVRLSKVGDTIGVNYHKWSICKCGINLGQKLSLPLYQFLKEPLIRRFGEEWWNECDVAAKELKKAGYI